MRVSDVMTRNVHTIRASESCQKAVERMSRAKIRHLPVVDDNEMLTGIVTDRDLRHRLFAPGVFREIRTVSVERLLDAVPVNEIMSTPVVTVEPDDDLEVAARLMLEDKLGSLPVVHGGRVVGIITETDLLQQIVSADSRRSPEVENIVVSFP